MAAPAEGGEVIGGFEGLAEGKEPGGGDAGVGGDDAEEFVKDAVGDLVIERPADAVDEEVADEEAEEHGEGECAGADDEF